MSKETYVKVEGYSSLVRETKTGAIINTNKSATKKRCNVTRHRNRGMILGTHRER